jgi:membrane-bound lytic murein transglycosylase B
MGKTITWRSLAGLLDALLLCFPARAAPCGGGFQGFIAARDAEVAGISRAVIDNALSGVTPDPAVLAFERRIHQ